MPSSPKLEGGLCLCDFCSESRALLFCRADEARLCLACDRQVHAANVVSSRHLRSPLCDSCYSAPASVLCCTQRLLLCHNCDFDAHRRDDRVGHVRRPLEPFSGCPGAVELMSALGLGADEKCLEGEGEEGVGGGGEDWPWEEKEVFNFEDLLLPMDSPHGFQPLAVPPLPKDRNLACGKHKEEILRQLRGLRRSEFDVTDLFLDQEQDVGFRPPSGPENVRMKNEDLPTRDEHQYEQEAADELPDNNEDDLLLWEEDGYDFFSTIPYDQLMLATREENQLAPDIMDGSNGISQREIAAGEMENDHLTSLDATALLSPRAQGLSGAERDSAISRYREKRKTRRYDKRVIYESRKTRAESRIRVKGRFAKGNREIQGLGVPIQKQKKRI